MQTLHAQRCRMIVVRLLSCILFGFVLWFLACRQVAAVRAKWLVQIAGLIACRAGALFYFLLPGVIRLQACLLSETS